jgi:hypothetical protein
VKRGVRGFDSAESPAADKAAALSPPPERASAKVDSRSARSQRRAVKHGAVGGRMTARWSGAVLGRNGGDAASPGLVSRSNAGGFPTALGGRVSKGDVRARVLVTRNVGCRSGFEASWRCTRGTPQGLTRCRVERRVRPPVWMRPLVISLAEGCYGNATVERPAQAPRWWCPANPFGP